MSTLKVTNIQATGETASRAAGQVLLVLGLISMVQEPLLLVTAITLQA